MTLPKVVAQREAEKFVEDTAGDVAVRTKVSESALPDGGATDTKLDDIITELEKKVDFTDSEIIGRWGSGVGEIDDIRIDPSTSSIQTIEYPHHEIHSGSHYYLEGYATLGNNAGVDDILRVKLVTPNTDKWQHFTWNISSSGILTTQFYEGASGGMANGTRPVIHANNRNKNCWSGKHTGANDQATVLTDSTKSWTVDALIGLQVFNETDKSIAFITDNDATTVTVAALLGGDGNEWDTNDRYEINNSQIVVTSAVGAADTNGTIISQASWGATDKFSVSGGGDSREGEIVLQQNTTYLRVFTSGAAANIVQFRASWYEHTDKH